MYEVELLNEANELLDHYRAEYFARYNAQPIITVIGHATTVMKDLLRHTSVDRIKRIITHYLKSDGDQQWYVRQGHSLECLKRSIAQVSAATPNAPKIQGPIKILFQTQCPLCKEFFETVATDHREAQSKAYTLACEKCGGHYVQNTEHSVKSITKLLDIL